MPQQLPLVTGGRLKEEEAEAEEGLGLRMVSVGGPRSLWFWPVTPVLSPGPGRGAALKAKGDVGWRSPGSVGF